MASRIGTLKLLSLVLSTLFPCCITIFFDVTIEAVVTNMTEMSFDGTDR